MVLSSRSTSLACETPFVYGRPSGRKLQKLTVPIGSMYGIFTYIYHKNQRNVGNIQYMDPMGWFIFPVFPPIFFSLWKGGRPLKFVKLLPFFFLIIILDLRWEVPGISMMLLTLFLDLMILFDLRFDADVLDIFRSICNHQICKLCEGPGNLELCMAVCSSVITALWAHVINVHLPAGFWCHVTVLDFFGVFFHPKLGEQVLDLTWSFITARFGCILAAIFWMAKISGYPPPTNTSEIISCSLLWRAPK